jgi:hypothetical protein
MTAGEHELSFVLPTPERVGTAQRLRELHTRVCVPEPVCRWCLTAWPCPEVRWSQSVLGSQTAAQLMV